MRNIKFHIIIAIVVIPLVFTYLHFTKIYPEYQMVVFVAVVVPFGLLGGVLMKVFKVKYQSKRNGAEVTK